MRTAPWTLSGEKLGELPKPTLMPITMPHPRTPPSPLLLLSLLLPLAGCSGTGETPVARARPGDTLVRTGPAQVVLERAFHPGQPNGLYRGIVVMSSPGHGPRRLEMNGVCSMPGLEKEGWPSYDNLFGSRSGATGAAQNQRRWQVLFHFDGRREISGGGAEGVTQADLAWLGRLRDNLCRRGSFDDRQGLKR